jgi:hypothetical protein
METDKRFAAWRRRANERTMNFTQCGVYYFELVHKLQQKKMKEGGRVPAFQQEF